MHCTKNKIFYFHNQRQKTNQTEITNVSCNIQFTTITSKSFITMEKIAKRHEKRNILKCDFYLFKISLKQTTALQGNLGLKHQG